MAKAVEAFRTISEVATELDVQKHVLRFWENKFPQVRPMKRGGGRRYYRPDDLELLRGIRYLLHREGYTIKGVQKLLREQGLDFVKACWQRKPDAPTALAGTKPAPGKPGRKPRKDIVVEVASVPEAARPSTGRMPQAAAAAAVVASKRTDHIAQLKKIVAELDACRKILRGHDIASLMLRPDLRARPAPK